MNRIKYIAVAALAGLLGACKNGDQNFPDFDYRTVYFAYQTPVRTLILGEDPESDNSLDNEHKCKIMATTGGGYSNPHDIVVRYTVDNSLVEGMYFKESGKKVYAMPSTYYSLSSDQLEIPAGKDRGGIVVEFTDDFFEDLHTLENCYVIPLRMTHVESADSILRNKDYILYAVKYINPWHAHYLRHGVDEIIGKTGHELLTKTNKRHNQYVENDETVMVSACAYRSVMMELNAKDEEGNNIPYSIVMTFDKENQCTVTSAEPESYSVTGTGKFVEKGEKNSWGGQDRNAIYVDYTVDLPQLTCHTTDTLVVHYRGVTFETFTPEYK